MSKQSQSTPLLPSVLTRYITKEIFIFFTICLMTFIGILITMRMLKLASLVINKGVAAQQVLAVLLAIIPTFLEIALPLAILLGTMLAFARLSGDSELVVLKASGVSLRTLTIPVILMGILVAAIALVTASHLKPWGYSTLARTFFEIARSRTTAGVTQGVFNKLGVLTLYAQRIEDSSGELSHVLIDDQRDPLNPKIIVAEKGWIKPDPEEQIIIFILKNGESHEQINGKYIVTNFDANRILINPDQLNDPKAQQKGASARELYNQEIKASINELSQALAQISQGQRLTLADFSPLGKRQLRDVAINDKEINKKLNRLRLEKHLRLALPCASLLLALIAFPLGIHPPRAQKTWGAGLSVMFGMLVFVVYYALLSVGQALAESGLMGPLLAAWLPNIVALSTSLYLINKLSNESWHSVTGGIAEDWSATIHRIKQLFRRS